MIKVGTVRLQTIAIAIMVVAWISFAQRSAHPASPALVLVAQSESDFPKRVREGVERAEVLGRAIFEKDVIAAKATDVLLASDLSAGDTRLRGWVTVPDGGGWVVYFFGEAEEGPLAHYEVRFDDAESRNPQVRALASQPPLAKLGSVMFRARQTAIPALTRPCVSHYNVVVLPDELDDKRGWLVYLLGASTKQGEVVLTGHMRVHVTANGENIVKAESLSRSCIVLDPPPGGAQRAGLVVSHVIDDWPIETHVYLSLLHDLPVYVGTSLGKWKVEAGSIFLTDQ